MKAAPWISALVAVGASGSGCNYTEGQCYPRDDGSGSEGSGGGVLIPGGVGGFGDGPLDPQEMAGPVPPDCNMVPHTPCNRGCLADYEDAAVKCAKIQSDAQRRACNDAAHAAYQTCREACRHLDATCTDMYEACQEKGMPCTRQVEWKKTLCAVCRDDCQGGRPYQYSDCYKCGFQ